MTARTVWTYLFRNDNTVIASTSHGWSPGGKWAWVARCFAEDFGCDPDDVSVVETEDDGDKITVKGEPVGYIIDEIKGAKIERPASAEAA